MDIVLVGVGGALGGAARFFLAKTITEKTNRAFPAATFLINISGAFLLGILFSLDVESRIWFLFGDGFLGAYTTFSTFMFEGFSLFKNKDRVNAAIYIFITVLLGLFSFAAGYSLGN